MGLTSKSAYLAFVGYWNGKVGEGGGGGAVNLPPGDHGRATDRRVRQVLESHGALTFRSRSVDAEGGASGPVPRGRW